MTNSRWKLAIVLLVGSAAFWFVLRSAAQLESPSEVIPLMTSNHSGHIAGKVGDFSPPTTAFRIGSGHKILKSGDLFTDRH